LTVRGVTKNEAGYVTVFDTEASLDSFAQ